MVPRSNWSGQFERPLPNEVMVGGFEFIGKPPHNFISSHSMAPSLFNFTKSHFLVKSGPDELNCDSKETFG